MPDLVKYPHDKWTATGKKAGGDCPAAPCSVLPSQEETELMEVRRAAIAYNRAYNRNREGWRKIKNRPWYMKLIPLSVYEIPPPLPRPLPARWHTVAQEKGWM